MEEIGWCDIAKIILIVFAILTFIGLCKKWSYDYDEEFRLLPDSDKEFLCSKNCCATEWRDTNIVNDGVDPKKYQATNINCSDGSHDTGCICVPKSSN
jgi:hypothetical protein